MIPRKEFVEKHRAEFVGLITVATKVGLNPQQLGQLILGLIGQVEDALGRCWDDVQDKSPLPVKNGQPQPRR